MHIQIIQFVKPYGGKKCCNYHTSSMTSFVTISASVDIQTVLLTTCAASVGRSVSRNHVKENIFNTWLLALVRIENQQVPPVTSVILYSMQNIGYRTDNHNTWGNLILVPGVIGGHLVLCQWLGRMLALEPYLPGDDFIGGHPLLWHQYSTLVFRHVQYPQFAMK